MGKKLFVIILSIMMVFLPAQATYALTTTELYNNAVNNIFFYSNTEDECDPEDMSGYVATATGDRMTWIGDNFSYTAQKVIREVYPGVSLFAEAGRNFSESGAAESGIDLVKRLAGANSLRKFVVFMLGLNGGDNKSEQESKDMINALISAVGDDKIIVLMTPYTRSRKYENFRKAVEATAKSNKNVLVADWAKAVQDDIDTYFNEGMDSINNTGYNMLVRVVKKALDDYTDSTKKKASSTVGASLGSGNQGASSSESGSSSGTSNVSSDAEGRAITIAQVLRGAGYNGNAIAAFLGSFQSETAGTFHPGRTQIGCGKNLGIITDSKWRITNSDWGGYPGKCGLGLAQWTYSSRQEGLQKFADQNGYSVVSLDAQIGYVLHETKTNRTAVRVEAMNALDSLAEATWYVFKKYEAPAAATKVNSFEEAKNNSSFNVRLNYAKKWLEVIEANGIAQGSGIVWEGGNPSTDSSESGSSNGAICSTNTKSGRAIAELARQMAWPNTDGTCSDDSGGSHVFVNNKSSKCRSTPRAKNRDVLTSLGKSASWAMDCAHFVYSVVHYLKLDDNFPGGSGSMWQYLQKESARSKWTIIPNIGNTSNLMPGDIAVYPNASQIGLSSNSKAYGHVQIYLGDLGGRWGDAAEASAGSWVARVGKFDLTHGDNGASSVAGNKYLIARYNGSVETIGESNVSGGGSCNFNSTKAEGCTLYCQSAEPLKSTRYGNKSGCTTYGAGGCGPTSLAMVIANLTGRKDVTPTVIGDKAVSLGARVCNSGTTGSKLISAVKDYGLKYEKINFNKDSINKALTEGKIVWMSSHGVKPFSRNGHFIAIRGRTSSGKWLLFNSACSSSFSASKKAYDPSEIIKASNGDIRGGPYAIWKE